MLETRIELIIKYRIEHRYKRKIIYRTLTLQKSEWMILCRGIKGKRGNLNNTFREKRKGEEILK